MTRWLAAALFAIVLIALAVYWSREHPLAMPLVHASEPASAVPWRLYTTHPVDRRNVPVLPVRRMV